MFVEYALIVVLSFASGYLFVPGYTYLYAGLSYLFANGMPGNSVSHVKRKLNAFSLRNLLCELVAVAGISLCLLVPYRLFFMLSEVPQFTNWVWLPVVLAGFIVFRLRQEKTLRLSRAGQPVVVDFRQIDSAGRVRLDSFWTIRDLERYLIKLEPGLKLTVQGTVKDAEGHRRKLVTEGEVMFDTISKRWVLSIDWDRELDRSLQEADNELDDLSTETIRKVGSTS